MIGRQTEDEVCCPWYHFPADRLNLCSNLIISLVVYGFLGIGTGNNANKQVEQITKYSNIHLVDMQRKFNLSNICVSF